ncbi:hypothetical protein RF11_12619 [Thelohanellus kitauei]|uniref:Uncharacterized protein n=1 Tax=Thelohanellus kitauei TaxID=669202 RepID=A0A0C2J5Q6_THEKT|nr:hypothetical protein RF11_12619 [Thelohanellus kitauei]
MFAIYIEVFDNEISYPTDEPIHKISLSGWKIPISDNTLSSLHSPNIFYDKNWTNVRIKFTIKDVIQGGSEFGVINLKKHVPRYSEKENNLKITNIKYFPFPGVDLSPTKRDNIFSMNALPYFVFKKSETKIQVNNTFVIEYSFQNITFEKLMSTQRLCGENNDLVAYIIFRKYIEDTLQDSN